MSHFDEVCDLIDVAEILMVSRQRVAQLHAEGRLGETRRLRSQLIFDRATIEAFAETRRRPQP